MTLSAVPPVHCLVYMEISTLRVLQMVFCIKRVLMLEHYFFPESLRELLETASGGERRDVHPASSTGAGAHFSDM